MFFAAYVGPSMNPTLLEPEVMEIVPYNKRPFRVGDVAFFLSPETNQLIVHRIIRIAPAGISTLGDNNTQKDFFFLQPENIKGRVVAAWRGQKRRKINGGLQGRLISYWLHWRRFLDRGVSPLLHPLYQVISRWQLFVWLLPARLRPRVVVFRVRGRDRFQLLMGKRIIGRYDDQKQQWQIQRPFKLFVNARLLLRQQDEVRGLPERQKDIDYLRAHRTSYSLILADGSRWEIFAVDEQALPIVLQFASAMQLRMTTGEIKTIHQDNLYRLTVHVDTRQSAVSVYYVPLASKNYGIANCILSSCGPCGDGLYTDLVKLSLVFARQAQARGGVLIHGALAERDGLGVILTAPGGTGKTTASNRFPAPWRSLCDDTTLVVRDEQGNYWAHPWPTWSRFLEGGPGGTWDVQNAVPLKGIFFLSQATKDRVEHLGPGHAVSMLVEGVGQVSTFVTSHIFKEEARALNLERFNNLCVLAKVVPVHVLHISLIGDFWQKIELILNKGSSHYAKTG